MAIFLSKSPGRLPAPIPKVEMSESEHLELTIGAAFCIQVADDMMSDLYNGIGRKYLQRSYLLESKRETGRLWQSFRYSDAATAEVFRAATAEVVDEYADKLHALYNELRVTFQEWNSCVINVIIATSFIAAAGALISFSTGSVHRHAARTLTVMNGLVQNGVLPLCRKNGVNITPAMSDTASAYVREMARYATPRIAGRMIDFFKELEKK